MPTNDFTFKGMLKAAVRVGGILLCMAVAVAAFGQQQINLTAGPAGMTLPDGTGVPMWGYTCGALVSGSAATCAPLSGPTSPAALGALGAVAVVNGGSGYTSAPTVTIAAPTAVGGVTATAVAQIADGQVVGMSLVNAGSGYTSAPAVTISGGGGTGAAATAGLAWSPVLITVPTGATGGLQINLSNNLSFTPAGATANNIPTSLVMVGQLGGGLGTGATYAPSPDHSQAQANVTWPVAGATPINPGVPPVQGPRVQSFATEVQAVPPGTTAATPLTWSNLRPGTYLLESGTHPSIQVPMGLYGMLVVTSAPTSASAGTAYPAVAATSASAAVPAVTYNAEIPLEFSEIDPVQNNAVNLAVNTAGFGETTVWTALTANGSMVSGLTLTNAGSGYASAPSVTISGGGGSGATAVATLGTNGAIALSMTSGGSGYTSAPSVLISAPPAGGTQAIATALVTLGGCGAAHTCYPPAVNYTPLYYLINGVAFNKTNAAASLFPASTGTATGTVTGTVLLRLVNAGLRMHVPSIVESQTTQTVGTTTSVPTGFSIIAEDSNVAPGISKVQSDIFMAAGKTFDVMINAACTPVAPATCPTSALPVYDRELSLSGNSSEREAGMLAYISINGAGLPAASGAFAAAKANPDTYKSLVAGQTFTVSDPSKGVIANDVNVYGVTLVSQATNGSVTLNANGTFTYVPNAGSTATTDSFGYCANGAAAGNANLCTTVSMLPSAAGTSTITANPITYYANTATLIKIPAPGVLSVDSDSNNFPLTVKVASVTQPTGATVTMEPNGGFNATASGPGTYTFTYQAQNSQGTLSSAATVTLIFPTPSNLAVTVLDGADKKTVISDYRWIIEEDKTFYVNPNCTTNSTTQPPGCPAVVSGGTVPTFGVNFHTSHMEYVAQGCTGPLSCESGQTVLHQAAVCDVGSGLCTTAATQQTAVLPSQVGLCTSSHTTNCLDPTKRYYLSVLPGDAANAFNAGNTSATCGTTATGQSTCGHGMTGAPIPAPCLIGVPCTSTAFAPITVLALPNPYPPGKLSVEVYEDDFPLNGEHDSGGGIDVLSPNEPGLGGFNIILWDDMGGSGDVTGQMTYDMFNQPLSNALAGQIDPATGFDACPISAQATTDPTQKGITGMIVTCPKYESDGHTLSPLAGQAVVANLMPGRFSVQAIPGADRIARGEEWLQTNTLDGQHPHDSFIRIGEPSYFQEFGPAGYHVSIGFANPAIINARHEAVCKGEFGAVGACNNTITGTVTGMRMSRTPDERLYSSGSRDTFYWTQCYVSLGDPDAEDFMFTKCDANGNFKFTNVPGGEWRMTIFDQWNDQIVDGLSTPANVSGGKTLNMGNIGVQQWQANVYTRTFVDDNRDGVYESNELGIPFLNTAVRYKDGSLANNLVTDFTGTANFNETFPLFNWYVVETDTTRYKTTGIHTVYDVGGPADGTSSCGQTTPGDPLCGGAGQASWPYNYLANTYENTPLPSDLSVPGAVYCTSADCAGSSGASSFAAGTAVPSSTSNHSTGRIDPPWVVAEGWQGFSGQNNFIEFGKAPYAPCPPACVTVADPVSQTTSSAGENGGIHGHVVYASTRPFDDPQMLVQTQWEPLVPHVTLNLYKEGFAADGVTPTLTLVDTTQTSSWDDWAQGFYSNSAAGSGTAAGQRPYMSCPGQLPAPTATTAGDLFFFSLYGQPDYLNLYNSQHGGPAASTLPYNSQYKCYDGMHNWNQLQPAPYDGMYSFPSVLGIDPTTGKQAATAGSTNGVPASMPGTNCTICVPNPTTATVPASGDLSGYDPYRAGTPMLPPGKYVVEVVMPPGYELVKEEDKNILIGDNFIAPVTQQFGALGNIFIIPDQASVASAYDPSGAGYNAYNAQNSTQSLGAHPNNQIVPGFLEPVWPCVGQARTVPDFISLFPQSQEVAPFAGATRNLCDRKEVTLDNQMGATAKFYIYTSTHIAAKFTGVITDDFTSEFDPFAPTFGEKFSPANLPVAVRDYLGNEISRVYSDHFGIFDGLTFSTWEVNPPNPTGYSPTMMVTCMNDAGPIPDPAHPGQTITDPLYNPGYSQFCYELPFMPGQTDYMDTPVVPTQAFVGAGYNNPDCNYPDATPAIKSVTSSDAPGPWVRAAGHSLTITALGNTTVADPNSCTTAGNDVTVPNDGYAGPSASVAPFNCKNVSRHYGFGGTAGTVSLVATDREEGQTVTVPLTITSWSDTTITATIPTPSDTIPELPACAVQQQEQYGGDDTQCGQLVITAANGKQSVDTVTVTIGGKKPTVLAPGATIQSAINAAAPGDMIIVPPGTYTEMVIMWKPVRLQGVGAASSIINANTQPAGKLLDPWRRHINCLFGLTLDGVPYTSGTNSTTSTTNSHPYDPSGAYSCPDTGWKYFTAQPNVPQIDRLPLEATVGWDATLNGNLAELLQEPSLMGAYEGAGITVVAKGLDFHGQNPWNDGSEAGAFPAATTLLSGVVSNPGATSGPGRIRTGDANPLCTSGPNGTNLFPSNYICNPSSIDGLSVTNSSQGGGGIFVHGWAHLLQIANNRVYNNTGTLSGGISVGQGEFAPPYIMGGTNAAPGSCSNGTGFVTNQHLPMCLQMNVNVHHNFITDNSSIGDELFSATLAGGGGASICTGNDYYKFNYNWICGNMSAGEGGGLVHLGEIFNGDIEHNSILFNQSINPTIPTNGGGLMIEGTPDTDPTCGTVPDADCPPGLSDGTGPNLVINANLIQGNSADSGSGGGIRLQQVNGTEVSTFPSQPNLWHSVNITNNIIVNNVAGWDGAGVSMQDALAVNLVNNTIAHNDSTASSGVLVNSLGAPLASATPGNCVQAGPSGPLTASCPQPSGLVSVPHSSLLTTTFSTVTLACPAGHYAPGTSATNGTCRNFSFPLLYNNVFWQNQSFQIGVGGFGSGTQNQQKTVTLYNASYSGTNVGPAVASQTATGSCSDPNASYWDIGVRGDTGPADHTGSGGVALAPVNSVLTSMAGAYSSTTLHNQAPASLNDVGVISQYCNGSRIPPECTAANGCISGAGWATPPGISDAVVPNPVFSLTPAATVDEGNNWINVTWGPLSLTNPALAGGAYGNYGGGPLLGNYSLQATSPAVGYIACNNSNANGAGCQQTIVGTTSIITAPTTDFFGNPRPDPNTPGRTKHIDVGAVELQIQQ